MRGSEKGGPLIIGADGLIGGYLRRILREEEKPHTGTTFGREAGGLRELDILDFSAVSSLLRELAPDTVYYCANLAGGVDRCEKEASGARRFHYDATVNLGSCCREAGAKLVFISTDYVFPDRELPAREEDPPDPLNIYGRLKLEAEDWIRENLPDFLIFRTTNVYGWDPLTTTPNYMMNLWRSLTAGSVFRAPSFLWGNPTYAGDLAAVMLRAAAEGLQGLYHAVGQDYLNRYQWSLQACAALGLPVELVEENPDAPAGMIPRPMRLQLSTEKLRRALPGDILGGLESRLPRMKQEIDGWRKEQGAAKL